MDSYHFTNLGEIPRLKHAPERLPALAERRMTMTNALEIARVFCQNLLAALREHGLDGTSAPAPAMPRSGQLLEVYDKPRRFLGPSQFRVLLYYVYVQDSLIQVDLRDTTYGPSLVSFDRGVGHEAERRLICAWVRGVVRLQNSNADAEELEVLSRFERHNAFELRERALEQEYRKLVAKSRESEEAAKERAAALERELMSLVNDPEEPTAGARQSHEDAPPSAAGAEERAAA